MNVLPRNGTTIILINMNKDYLLELAKDEYFSLRSEVLATVERQYSIANWCISSIAVLAAGILGGWDTLSKSTTFLPIFVSIALPALVTSYIITWTHVISKIHLLGKRLWQIEENISLSVSSDLIKSTFNIKSSTNKIDPFTYLLGWEHVMWTKGNHEKIITTIKLVKLSLLFFYITTTCLGLAISMKNSPLITSIPFTLTTMSFFVFMIVFFTLSHYLNKIIQK